MYALKAALCALAAFPLVSNTPTPPIAQSAIPKVICPVPGGYSAGTAFRIGPHLLLSVKHVTNYPLCFIDGRKVTVKYTSPTKDFSILTDDRDGPSLRVDCGGFIKGHKYLAIGHARALDKLTTVELEATGEKDGQFAILTGTYTVIPGQSGGAIIDAETFEVVGMINVYNYADGMSGSVPLRDTSVCSK